MRQVVNKQDGQNYKSVSEPVFLILTSLAGQPRHGYALLQDIEEISNHRVTLSTGTLYGAIRRLLEDGLIERFEQADKSRDKQAYRLTMAGRMQLQSEVERMRQMARAAALRMRGSEV